MHLKQRLFQKIGFHKPNNPKPVGKHLTILSDDTFVVSYPKSGNTWLRFLIANLLHDGTPVSFKNIESHVPDIYRNTDKALLELPRPRILKSHELYQPDYQKVIYIIRDPRDVAVSYYYHLIKVQKISAETVSIDSFVDDYLRGSYHQQFGDWQTHVSGWMAEADSSRDFLLLQYENLLDETHDCLLKIAAFLDVQISQQDIRRSIEQSRADRLRQLEVEEDWQPFEGDMRKDRRFVRSAKAGDWQTHLPTTAVRKIEAIWGSTMIEFGYL